MAYSLLATAADASGLLRPLGWQFGGRRCRGGESAGRESGKGEEEEGQDSVSKHAVQPWLHAAQPCTPARCIECDPHAPDVFSPVSLGSYNQAPF